MILSFSSKVFSVNEIKVADVRIQLLSPHLVRLEILGPLGFEDRKTFLVTERNWQEVKFLTVREGNAKEIQTKFYKIRILDKCRGLQDIEIRSAKGDILYKYDGLPFKKFVFPAPHEMKRVFVLADIPRVIPPLWGATPPPDGALPPNNPLAKTSGWDFRNYATDIYVFICDGATYSEIRAEYLRLTGRIPLPPLFVLGFWDSRYYPYTDKEALSVIDRYRKEGIPLDVFVVDTDWRKGGSDGYEIETKYFSNLRGFFEQAHKRNVRVAFNDHPVSQAKPLDQAEFKYRWDGLTSILDLGLDFWWYDKNWGKIINSPIEEIDREIWGQRIYYDIISRYRPATRPLLMSMVSQHPASHRYPIWWTGDISSTYDALKEGVGDTIKGGINFLPWIHQDLGGHTGSPSAELYVRFLEWGCLSPVTRVHCTSGQIRYPWAFGEEAQKIVTEYIRLRYRLIPTIYTAARRAYDDGTPILRRCDFDYPQFSEARDNTQYLLGDDILVAPIISEKNISPIPENFFRTPDGKSGMLGEYFANKSLEGKPALVRIDRQIDFEWGGGSPDTKIKNEEFSARWTGMIGPAKEDINLEFALTSDDGVRLWFDDKLVLDKWILRNPATDFISISVVKGKIHKIRIEFFENTGAAVCKLGWIPPKIYAERSVWIPPGMWENVWTGEIVSGQIKMNVQAPLWMTPMFVRRGAIVSLAPEMQFTSEKPWNPITLEVYPPVSGSVVRQLYEDDGHSLDYVENKCSVTWFAISRKSAKQIDFAISSAKGNYEGQLTERGWIVRFHLTPDERPSQILIDGKNIMLDIKENNDLKTPHARIILPSAKDILNKMPEMPLSGKGTSPPASAGVVVEVWLNSQKIILPRNISILLN